METYLQLLTRVKIMSKEEKKMSFEKAYARLEEILDKMNSGLSSLTESLSLYEEAHSLIQLCQKELSQAEKKVQILLKTSDDKPSFEDFIPDKEQILLREEETTE